MKLLTETLTIEEDATGPAFYRHQQAVSVCCEAVRELLGRRPSQSLPKSVKITIVDEQPTALDGVWLVASIFGNHIHINNSLFVIHGRLATYLKNHGFDWTSGFWVRCEEVS